MKSRCARLLALVMLLAPGCSSAPDERYVTTPAEMGDVRDVVPATGRVKAASQIEVRAEVAGRVVAVMVQPNAPVHRGEILARISPDRRNLQVQTAQADYAAASASLAESNARHQRAQQNLEGRRALSEKGYVSANALRDSEAETRAAAAAVDRARAESTAAGVKLRTARADLEDVLIRSPADGYILARSVEVGQLVNPTSEVPLFIVTSQVQDVVVEALVAEPDIGRIQPSLEVKFSVEAYPTTTFQGRVRDILREPRTDRSLVSYPVLIDAANADGSLFPGMTASVEFIHADARNVLRVPVQALYITPSTYEPVLSDELTLALKRQGLTNREARIGAELGTLIAAKKQRIFVLENGRPVARAVRVGAQSTEFVEVVDGLKPGESVIVQETGARAPGRS